MSSSCSGSNPESGSDEGEGDDMVPAPWGKIAERLQPNLKKEQKNQGVAGT